MLKLHKPHTSAGWQLVRSTSTVTIMALKKSVSAAKSPTHSIERKVAQESVSISLKTGFTYSFKYADCVTEIISIPRQDDEADDDDCLRPDINQIVKQGLTSSESPVAPRARSYSYFTNLNETYIYLKIETDKNIFYQVPIPQVAFAEEVTEDFYETEKWWFQLVSEMYPDGYDKDGRPADHRLNPKTREYKYNFTLLDSFGSETDVDRDVFDSYFPECKRMVCYRNEHRLKIWGSYEAVRDLAWYLSGNEPVGEGLDSLGDLILISEEYKGLYLKHWCIRRILSTQWSDISLQSAAELYERLSETDCEEMKQLKPLLFRLIQQKMMSLDRTKWSPPQILAAEVGPEWTCLPGSGLTTL
ncbi:YALIA101S01e28744g1_1 [Yarrowia lipolytica]|nr:YALIA101S01e28744g1_1 [Yarrowia lipolytica]